MKTSQKIINEYLIARKENSFEEMADSISETIAESLNNTKHSKSIDQKKFKKSLYSILVNKKASFSTPALLSVGVDKAPKTASCYIVNIDNLSQKEIIQMQNNIFDSYGGIGFNLGRHEDVKTILEASEDNAKRRYCGLPNRGCSIMAVIDCYNPKVREFMRAKYRGNNFLHVMKDVLITEEFLTKAKKYDSPERNTLEELVEGIMCTGTPGLLFEENINRDQPYKIRATNPCSEFLCADDTSATIASINLATFVKDQKFDYSAFKKTADVMTIGLNVLLDISTYPTKTIERNTKAYRPIGLGLTNVAYAINLMGLKYDSFDARKFAGKISKILRSRVESMGYKNTQTTLIAPTGRIGRLMDCKSLGLESYDLNGEISELLMMSAVQPNLSGGISNTIIYPSSVKKEEIIRDIYAANSLGLKGYAGYVLIKS